MPVIVDPKLFESVQRKLAMNNRSKSRLKSDVDFLLTGKLYCGHCGKPMAGTSGTSKTGDKYYYYSCRIHGNKCIKQNEKKDVLENAVLDYLTSTFLTDENIEKIADKVIELIESDKNKAIVGGIKAEKKNIERKIKNLVDIVSEGKGTDELISRLRQLEEERDNLDLQLARAKFEEGYLTKEMIIFYFSQFKDGNDKTIGMRSHLIDALIRSIHIFDTKENQNSPECSDNDSYGSGRRLVIAFNTSADVENPITLECSDLARMVERTSSPVDNGGKYAVTHFYVLDRGFILFAVVYL